MEQECAAMSEACCCCLLAFFCCCLLACHGGSGAGACCCRRRSFKAAGPVAVVARSGSSRRMFVPVLLLISSLTEAQCENGHGEDETGERASCSVRAERWRDEREGRQVETWQSHVLSNFSEILFYKRNVKFHLGLSFSESPSNVWLR